MTYRTLADLRSQSFNPYLRDVVDTLYTGIIPITARGADPTGERDSIGAIEETIEEASEKGHSVYGPGGTYKISRPARFPADVPFFGDGIRTVLKASSSFPSTYTTGSYTFDAPILFFDSRTAAQGSPKTVENQWGYYRNFAVDGDDVAPGGIVVTAGSQKLFQSINVTNVTKTNVVTDGVQNSTFLSVRADDSAEHNYKILNGTANTAFISCNGRVAGTRNLFVGKDANYPSDTTFFSGQPTRCNFYSSIWEDVDTDKDRTAYIEDGSEVYFSECEFTSTVAVTTCGVEFGANASLCGMRDCRIIGVGEEVPAIIDRGFRTTYQDIRLSNWGTTTLADLIEVYNASANASFIRPHFSNINVTGKHIANKSASPNDSRAINYVPYQAAHSVRPTEDIDARYQFYDVSLTQPIFYDFISDVWRLADGTVNP